MKQYLQALQDIMDNGVDRDDRTGVGTRSLFAYQLRFNLLEGFPAMTTKKLAWKGVKSELLWMIEGSNDERRLAEIHYGKPRIELEDKTTIWTANAQSDYWKPKFEGDLGSIYGVQWRDWGTCNYFEDTYDKPRYIIKDNIDQLANVIENIKTNPNGRRHIVTAWNPGELDDMALPPCHIIFQFYVANNKLSCHMFQRSCDMFLGVPFNIASYALLTHMVAQVCSLHPGELVVTLGDAHIYHNHYDQVKEQLSRSPLVLPLLVLDPHITDIDDFSMGDIRLINYKSHDTIKAKMAL